MKNNWKTAFFVETVVVLLFVVGTIGFFLGKRSMEEPGKFKMESGPVIAVNQTRPSDPTRYQPTSAPVLSAQQEVVEQSPTSSPTPTPIEIPELIEAVYSITEYSPETYTIRIDRQIDNFATGGIKQAGQAGREYYLAVNTGEAWEVVFYGENLPVCEEVDSNDFPIEMVPSCVNSSGTVVSR